MNHIKTYQGFFLTENKEEKYSDDEISEIIRMIENIISNTKCTCYKIGKTAEIGFDSINGDYNDNYNCYMTIISNPSREKIDDLESKLITHFKSKETQSICDNIRETKEDEMGADKGDGFSVYLVWKIDAKNV